MSLRSPRSPRGFVPLGTSYSNMPENDIPLTQIRSTASSTGARKASQGLGTGFEQNGNTDDNGNNEKHHFFHRGRRQAIKEERPKSEDGLADNELSLNAMGRFYNRIIHASVVTRYLIYIVPITLLLAVPLIVLSVLDKTNDIPVGRGPKGEEGPPLFDLFLWIEIGWLALWLGKLVAWLLAPVFMFLTGVVSPGTRKYAAVLRNLQIPLSLFFWALADWLVFINILQTHHSAVSWTNTIQTILGAAFVSSAIFLGEKAFVQLISISYHQRSFANRIQDSKRDVHLLGLMYDASRKLFPMYCEEFLEEDEIINDSIEMLLAGNKKGKKTRKSGAVIPAKLIGNVGRFGNKVTSAFGNLASEITGKQVFNPNSAHSIVIEALEKVKTSEALAKRIWMSFVVEGKDALYAEDIAEVLGPAHQDDAEECFGAIDADGNGDISLDEMIRKVVEIGKERKAIGNSMQDIGQALGVFDNILLFIVLLIVIFVFLAFFQSSFVTTLATAGTALLSLSFIFAVTTQEFLGSCIFLFVKHPYDVGDRVDITGPEKEQLIVERISLLYTIFTRIDRMQVVQIPNIVLNNLWIENVTRSKAMKEVIDVNVSYDTSFEDIELLRLEMEKFVQAPENSRDFQQDITVSVGSVGDLDKLQLKIAIKHKSNWHNDAVRATRRSKFMCALVLALKKIPIYAPGGGGEALGGPTNPTYSVSVSDMEAAAARDKAAKNKDAGRLVPRSSPNAAGEVSAAQGLNTLDPLAATSEEWGYNRDDNTLNDSRGQSIDRTRSNDIESARSDLRKTESQRSGFRRAGESVPTESHPNRAPSFQVTQHMTPFDEEAQVGGPNPFAMYNPDIQPASAPYSASSSNRVDHTQASSGSGARQRGASISRPQNPNFQH
ncbi:serine/threonine protein kinase [Xylariaceae sp. FL1651]|nr:serine/threonine protein kinase [Xylariaceae sp. FL1651]